MRSFLGVVLLFSGVEGLRPPVAEVKWSNNKKAKLHVNFFQRDKIAVKNVFTVNKCPEQTNSSRQDYFLHCSWPLALLLTSSTIHTPWIFQSHEYWSVNSLRFVSFTSSAYLWMTQYLSNLFVSIHEISVSRKLMKFSISVPQYLSTLVSQYLSISVPQYLSTSVSQHLSISVP